MSYEKKVLLGFGALFGLAAVMTIVPAIYAAVMSALAIINFLLLAGIVGTILAAIILGIRDAHSEPARATRAAAVGAAAALAGLGALAAPKATAPASDPGAAVAKTAREAAALMGLEPPPREDWQGKETRSDAPASDAPPGSEPGAPVEERGGLAVPLPPSVTPGILGGLGR